jgi:hypothetical protein
MINGPAADSATTGPCDPVLYQQRQSGGTYQSHTLQAARNRPVMMADRKRVHFESGRPLLGLKMYGTRLTDHEIRPS